MFARIRAAGLGLIAAVFIPLSAPAHALTEDLPETPILTNAFQTGWLQFGINGGRLTLDGSRGVNVATSSGGIKPRERLSVRMTGGDPMVEYELTAADQEMTIEMSSHNRFHLHRKPKDDSKVMPVEIEQPAQGAIVFRIGEKDHQQVYHFPGVWHLVVVEPELAKAARPSAAATSPARLGPEQDCRRDRVPLVAAATDHVVPDSRRWAQWVAQLGDPQFSKREVADRQLREAGRVVLSFLEQLDRNRLDAEQQFRVRRILAVVAESEGNDTPEQVAAWLAGDTAVWLAMLSRNDLATRKLATRQLGALLGSPIHFDPTADADVRRAQIGELRATLAGER